MAAPVICLCLSLSPTCPHFRYHAQVLKKQISNSSPDSQVSTDGATQLTACVLAARSLSIFLLPFSSKDYNYKLVHKVLL